MKQEEELDRLQREVKALRIMKEYVGGSTLIHLAEEVSQLVLQHRKVGAKYLPLDLTCIHVEASNIHCWRVERSVVTQSGLSLLSEANGC